MPRALRFNRNYHNSPFPTILRLISSFTENRSCLLRARLLTLRSVAPDWKVEKLFFPPFPVRTVSLPTPSPRSSPVFLLCSNNPLKVRQKASFPRLFPIHVSPIDRLPSSSLFFHLSPVPCVILPQRSPPVFNKICSGPLPLSPPFLPSFISSISLMRPYLISPPQVTRPPPDGL